MKLIGIVVGQDCERTIDLAIKSLEGCDNIIYCDGGSTDRTLEIAKKYNNIIVIHNKWDKNKYGMASIQKNLMLDHVKEKYMGDWIIYLDADEMLDDDGVKKIKEFIKNSFEDTYVYDVKMRHLIYNLRFEDSIYSIHRAPTRLFKVSKELYYPKTEHCTLEGQINTGFIIDITIWHLAYCGGIWDIEKRYKDQKRRRGTGSHDIEFLNKWRSAHLFGNYPINKVNPEELPTLLLNRFDISKDEIYFQNRGIEIKHPILIKQWCDYFKPESVLDLGCGKGSYLYFWEWFIKNCWGIEISEYAIRNKFCKSHIYHSNINDGEFYPQADLITAVDILEHLNDEDLDSTLKNMSKYGKQFLFSIPFIGNPNLEKDKTHIQKKTKGDWIKLIESYGIKIKPIPENWMFREQILVGEKNEK